MNTYRTQYRVNADYLTIPNPDDERGMPIYDGDATGARARLEAGTYPATLIDTAGVEHNGVFTIHVGTFTDAAGKVLPDLWEAWECVGCGCFAAPPTALRTLLKVMLTERGLRTWETQTGGNCTALVVTAPGGSEDGRHMLVTDGNACLPFSSEDTGIVACIYVDADDEGTLVLDADPIEGTGATVAAIVATLTAALTAATLPDLHRCARCFEPITLENGVWVDPARATCGDIGGGNHVPSTMPIPRP